MLAAVLTHLYPGISFADGGDCTLQDDGAGPFIAAWRRPEPQPTTEQIEAARKPAALALVTERIRAECERRQRTLGFLALIDGAPVRFQSDQLSCIRYGFLLSSANEAAEAGYPVTAPFPPPPLPQTLWHAWGAVVPMTIQRARAIRDGLLAHEVGHDVAYRAHVAAAALLDDPLAYDYSTGWPE
jgi:hypothetical protein